MTTTPADTPTHRFLPGLASKEDCSAAKRHQDQQFRVCLGRPVPLRDGDPTRRATRASATRLGFYIMPSRKQAPILKMLADRFTLSDNFHQSFHGGNRRQPLSCSAPATPEFWSDGQRAIRSRAPPRGPWIAKPEFRFSGTVKPLQKHGRRQTGGMCSDVFQPGVKPIVSYLGKPALCGPSRNCQPNHYLHAQQRQSRLSCRTVRWVGRKQRAAIVPSGNHRRRADRKEGITVGPINGRWRV